MGIVMSLDKQLEKKAIKWYEREVYGMQLEKSEKQFKKEIIRRIDKQEAIKQYLKAHPKIKVQYRQKKQRLNRIKMAAGLGILTVGIGSGIAYTNTDKKVEAKDVQKVEYDYQPTIQKINEIAKEKQYNKFFENIESISNTEKRDNEIINFTKERMVEAYNKQNEDNPITVERLEYNHLDENVVVNKDQFGNDVSYERVSQTEQIDVNKNQEFKKLQKGIYVYKIDGKTVAVYDSNGQEVKDSEIENKEEFFKNTIELTKEAEALQGIYKYKNSETNIEKAKNKYRDTAKDLCMEKEIEKNDIENIR